LSCDKRKRERKIINTDYFSSKSKEERLVREKRKTKSPKVKAQSFRKKAKKKRFQGQWFIDLNCRK
jgi:hypothetical protein